MQYIKGIENYRNEHASAITLGKFDGLHLGHELLIERVIWHKERDAVDSVVFAFDMTPLYQKKKIEYSCLLSNAEKAKRLDGRVDYFVDCPFVDSVAKIEAEAFIEKILVDTFHARYVVIGTDFRFGHNRRGDAGLLQKYSKIYGYEVEVIEKKQYQGREISSTYIKEELKKGNLALVDVLLGYSYEKFKQGI